MSTRKELWILLSVALVGVSFAADQSKIRNFNEAQLQYWEQVYSLGGESLYCGEVFSSTGHYGMKVDQMISSIRMMDAAGCAGMSLTKCRQVSSSMNSMEADLHNLWPALSVLSDQRGRREFGEVADQDSAQEGCHFKVGESAVEPRPEVRGEIARSMFYMMSEYGIELSSAEFATLSAWNRSDSPDEKEEWRNGRIADIQGTRNPFVDDPSLVPESNPNILEPEVAEMVLELNYRCKCSCASRSVFIDVARSECRSQTSSSCEIVSSGRSIEAQLSGCRTVQTNRQ